MPPVPLPAESSLPEGVRLTPLQVHDDPRGSFTEIFRSAWDTGVEPLQWNAVASAPSVMRGVHVHVLHDDYLVVVAGSATVGLRDLRAGATSPGLTIDLTGREPVGITIPHGVAHGFVFHEQSLHVYSTSTYFNTDDELGCRWDDPGLEIPWSVSEVTLSPRDQALPGLQELRAALPW